MKTIGTLFSGFGGVDIGAKEAGIEPTWGIELDAKIAEVAQANLEHRVYVRNILDCDPFDFDAVDILHASPPCPNFSIANANGDETELDIALGRKVAEFIRALCPPVFTLENVWAYRLSRSWWTIQETLHEMGYWVSVEHVNAADMGVPQTRKRMIVRAVRSGFVPYLPQPVPWVGWYAAIEDLIDDLPAARFASWQLARLPELLKGNLIMQVQGEGGDGVRWDTEPMQTVTSNHGVNKYRAFLINESSTMEMRAAAGSAAAQVASPRNMAQRAWLVDSMNSGREISVRERDEPALTITCDAKPSHKARALFDCGRVVAMTTRALARFQSFPDWYELPDNTRLAAKGIGNAVPPLMYRRVMESLLEVMP